MSDTPESILKKYWGYDNFRPDQRNIVASILAGKDTLALLPTGGGKSVCFQVPGMLLLDTVGKFSKTAPTQMGSTWVNVGVVIG